MIDGYLISEHMSNDEVARVLAFVAAKRRCEKRRRASVDRRDWPAASGWEYAIRRLNNALGYPTLNATRY